MRNGKYELVIAPDEFPGMKYRGRYCYEHTLVYWMATGVIPGPGECIHHKNDKKRDNRFENLELKKEHPTLGSTTMSAAVNLLNLGARLVIVNSSVRDGRRTWIKMGKGHFVPSRALEKV